jgi:hypothetical protein
VGFCADAPAVVDDRVAVVADDPPGVDGPGPGMAVLDAGSGEPVGTLEAVDGEFAVGDGRVAFLRGSSLRSIG